MDSNRMESNRLESNTARLLLRAEIGELLDDYSRCLDDGRLDVPTGPGIGVDPLPDVLADLTVWSTEIRLGQG